MSLELIKVTLNVMHSCIQIMLSTSQKKPPWQRVVITCIIREAQTIHTNVNSLKFMVLSYEKKYYLSKSKSIDINYNIINKNKYGK